MKNFEIDLQYLGFIINFFNKLYLIIRWLNYFVKINFKYTYVGFVYKKYSDFDKMV